MRSFLLQSSSTGQIGKTNVASLDFVPRELEIPGTCITCCVQLVVSGLAFEWRGG